MLSAKKRMAVNASDIGSGVLENLDPRICPKCHRRCETAQTAGNTPQVVYYCPSCRVAQPVPMYR